MKKKFSINTLIPILSFLILFCVFLIATRGTLVTPQNISNIVSQAFPVIIGGTGVLFVTAMGSTDLSVGANAALSATLGAMAASHLGTWAIFPWPSAPACWWARSTACGTPGARCPPL